VHSDQDQFIQPGWVECVFSIFSLGLCFVCSFVPFDLFVSPVFVFLWAVESFEEMPFKVLCASVTKFNQPPRAVAASTIMWVRSYFHPFWAVVDKSNAG